MASIKMKQTDFWKNHINQYRSSGLSRGVYCRKHGLKPHQLDYRIGKEKNINAKSSDGAFAKVVVRPTSGSLGAKPGLMRIHFSGGVTMDMPFDADPTWIAQLICNVGGGR